LRRDANGFDDVVFRCKRKQPPAMLQQHRGRFCIDATGKLSIIGMAG
jgi:hypothetical protein